MAAVLHRIEALPGEGRYAVTFLRPDASEQTAIARLEGDELEVAEASLPAGWSKESAVFADTEAAVRAFDRARRSGGPAALLRDVAGGWDVSLGNVVLGDSGVPVCTGHGAMAEEDGAWVCGECSARAYLG